MKALAPLALLAACAAAQAAQPLAKPASNTDPEGKVGERPYEMAWANRQPEHPELVDFEDLAGWNAVGFNGCTAELVRSREELMYGAFTGKVTYTGQTAASHFELRPPQPVPIPGEPTAVQLWVRGNNWGWHPTPATARTNVHALVRDAQGEQFVIGLGHVNFDYWFLMHAAFVSPTGQLTGRIRPQQPVGAGLVPAPARGAPTRGAPTSDPSKDGDGRLDYPLSFVALRVTNCADERPARLFFDSLQFYRAEYPALSEPKLPPADAPWPTTPETITPTPTERVRNSFSQEGPARVFTARGRRDTIRWTYLPKTGTLDDLSVEVNGKRFQPCAGGGPVFESGGAPELAGIEQTRDGELLARWSIPQGAGRPLYSFRFRAKDKSLQVSVEADGAAAFHIGRTKGTPNADLVSVPYLSYGHVGPHVVHWDGVFLSGWLDWYNSDASQFFAEHGKPEADQVIYNGGSRYLPKTDGARNPLRERLILTVASDFHEVLPNIPHPRNPMAHLATGSVWRNIGQPNEELLKRLKAGGVERFICPLHEIGWRDAGESFTFRLRCAPRIGDEKMREYGKWVNSLGYRFGLYANYTDYAPVNEHWREDRVCLDSDGNRRRAWPRCYAPKPTWAWQAQAELAPKIAEKFGATTCYSDVHTAVTPWDRTDYDARVPGAGMLRASWESYARILWNECQAYGGPVFSEGRMQWMYAGLVSGNYGQMTGPDRWRQPPLVDFDLLKMHPLMCDFGMGQPSMFYEHHGGEWRRDKARISPWLDRFITSTLAFGHIGYLPMEWGIEGALKSYYMTNAVQQRYALVPAADIRYFDGSKLLTTSEAIRTGAYRRGQVYVKYASGLELWCNLSFDHDWQVACDGKTWLLPPTGHLAFKKGDMLQCSAIVDGQRIDYVESLDYHYLDTRGQSAAFGPLAGRGAAALKPIAALPTSRGFRNPREVQEWWAIPCDKCDDLTLRRPVAAAQAHGLDGQPLGEPEVRASNLGHTILPVKGATSYRLRLEGRPAQLDSQVRKLVIGLEYPVDIVIVNTGKGVLRNAEAVAELLATPPAKAARWSNILQNVGPSPAIAPGREARARLAIRVPEQARPGERLWYRLRVAGKLGGQAAEGVGWFTGIAARAVEAEAAPAAAAPQRPGSTQQLVLSLKSNLPEAAEVAVAAEAEGIALSPRQRALRLEPGRDETLSLAYVLPTEPAVVPLTFAFTLPHGSQGVRRWLRFTPGKAVAMDLAKLAPDRTGVQFRGKQEELLTAESGASFRAAANTVGGVEKPGFFCHPPYKGGVGLAFGEFEVTLPDEPCEFETLVGFADGSTTADGCVFSVQVREPPAGSKPAGGSGAGGWETVGRLQFGELKRWQFFRADLSPFRGKRVALRLVTDVGPADDSNSDWAAWGEPRIVLAGERLAVEVLDQPPRAPGGPKEETR